MTECTKCHDGAVCAIGLCRKCYNSKYREDVEHREKIRLRSERYRRLRGSKPMSENRKCSAFLGVHVAERVLRNAFKEVEQMPYGNRGYDFICNRGKKIDVKSSALHKREKQADHWQFIIKKNTTADYFMCLAFDNRDDLNPLHIWMIPGNTVNDKTGISITKSTIDKWDEYRIPIDKTITCCDKLKHGGLKQDG